MKPDSKAAGFRCSRASAGVLALLSMSFSAIAFGATNLRDDCDQADRNFPRNSDQLTVSVVDLTDDESSVGLEHSIDDLENSDDAIAPLLFLAPRVASILDDVFDEENEHHPGNGVVRKTSVAPLAESTDEPLPAIQTNDVDTAVEVQPSLMRIQRQMYRTDI